MSTPYEGQADFGSTSNQKQSFQQKGWGRLFIVPFNYSNQGSKDFTSQCWNKGADVKNFGIVLLSHHPLPSSGKDITLEHG